MLGRSLLMTFMFAASAAVRADATGTVTSVLDHPYPVRDALALRDGERTRVVLTSIPFDWIDFAADGKLDAKDLVRHQSEGAQLGTIELVFDADGFFRSWDSEDFEDGINPVGGWKRTAADATHIAGTFDYASTNVTFDVPIRDAPLEPAGVPLSAVAEPVRALVAYFDAQRRRNVRAVLALAMTAEEIAGVDAAQEKRFAESLEPSPLSVERIEFRGGRVAGDVAQVDYAVWTMIDEGKVRRARVVRVDGKWIVREAILD